MIAKEKVIKGLKQHRGGRFYSCDNCPYVNETDCQFKLYSDALILLKEQEAVDKNTGEWKNGHCSCCGEDVSSKLDTWTNVQNFLFCPNCGAKMEGR